MEFSSWVKKNDKFMVKYLEDFVKNSNINKYVFDQKEENTKNYFIRNMINAKIKKKEK